MNYYMAWRYTLIFASKVTSQFSICRNSFLKRTRIITLHCFTGLRFPLAWQRVVFAHVIAFATYHDGRHLRWNPDIVDFDEITAELSNGLW